jgi:hypothetical protein
MDAIELRQGQLTHVSILYHLKDRRLDTLSHAL